MRSEVELGCKSIGSGLFSLNVYRQAVCIGDALSISFHTQSNCQDNTISMGSFRDVFLKGCVGASLNAAESTVLSSLGMTGSASYYVQAVCGRCLAPNLALDGTPLSSPTAPAPPQQIRYKITHSVTLRGVTSSQFTETVQDAFKSTVAYGLRNYNVRSTDVFIWRGYSRRDTSLTVDYQVILGADQDQSAADTASQALQSFVSGGGFISKLSSLATTIDITSISSGEPRVVATLNGVTYSEDDSGSDSLVWVVVIVFLAVLIVIAVGAIMWYRHKASVQRDKVEVMLRQVPMATPAESVAALPVDGGARTIVQGEPVVQGTPTLEDIPMKDDSDFASCTHYPPSKYEGMDFKEDVEDKNMMGEASVVRGSSFVGAVPSPVQQKVTDPEGTTASVAVEGTRTPV